MSCSLSLLGQNCAGSRECTVQSWAQHRAQGVRLTQAGQDESLCDRDSARRGSNFFAISGVLRMSFQLPIIPAGIFGSGSAEVHCITDSSPQLRGYLYPRPHRQGEGCLCSQLRAQQLLVSRMPLLAAFHFLSQACYKAA